jgi:hypothetical protein
VIEDVAFWTSAALAAFVAFLLAVEVYHALPDLVEACLEYWFGPK